MHISKRGDLKKFKYDIVECDIEIIRTESMCTVPIQNAYEACKLIEECSIAGGEDLAVKLSCDLAITKNWYGQEYTFNENHELVPMKER